MTPAQLKHPRSLRRRLMIQIGLMIVGLLLLSATAVVGINGLHHDYGIALRGYQQLREVYEIGQGVATARAALTAQPADRSGAQRAMQAAGFRISTSRELEDVVELRRAVEEASTVLTVESMDAALGQVARESARIRATVTAAQDAAVARRRMTLLAVMGISALVLLGGVVIGMQQYRAVMHPLRRLAGAVREVAAGRFSGAIDERGDREFLELASDFNRMSAELGALYRELEQKVRDKSKELVRSERLASVGYLAAGVAHEINNPLGIITGYGERALRQLDAEGHSSKTSRTRKAIEVMCEEAYRCKQITDRLLSLARGGSESFGPVDLARACEEVISNLTALPEYRDRPIVLETDPRAPLVVRGRDGEIRQVILNLLINALQASIPSPGTPGEGQGEGRDLRIEAGPSLNPLPEYRERGPKAAVGGAHPTPSGAPGTAAVTAARTKVTVARVADHIELVVLDHGRGIDAHTLDRIFEPFFTTQRGAARGTGLGLSITHAIITDHGGTIAAYSEGAGRGSRFVVRLPAMQNVTEQGSMHVEH